MMQNSLILKLPYMSQINGKGTMKIGNDCGPTCCWMLLKGYGLLKEGENVDDLYRSVVPNGDRYTSWEENQKILSQHGLFSRYAWQMRMDDLFEGLSVGMPTIVLVDYGVLQYHMNCYASFSGNHYMLVVGMDETHVWVHDPLWLNQDGAYLQVPKSVFEAAWNAAEGVKGSGLMMTSMLESNEPILAQGVVRSSIGLNLRTGADVSYAIVSRLLFQDSVAFAEMNKDSYGNEWGRLVNSKVWCAINYEGSGLVKLNVKKKDDEIFISVEREKIQTAIDLLTSILMDE